MATTRICDTCGDGLPDWDVSVGATRCASCAEGGRTKGQEKAAARNKELDAKENKAAVPLQPEQPAPATASQNLEGGLGDTAEEAGGDNIFLEALKASAVVPLALVALAMVTCLAYVVIESVVLYTFTDDTHLPYANELYPWVWLVPLAGCGLIWLVAQAAEDSD